MKNANNLSVWLWESEQPTFTNIYQHLPTFTNIYQFNQLFKSFQNNSFQDFEDFQGLIFIYRNNKRFVLYSKPNVIYNCFARKIFEQKISAFLLNCYLMSYLCDSCFAFQSPIIETKRIIDYSNEVLLFCLHYYSNPI